MERVDQISERSVLGLREMKICFWLNIPSIHQTPLIRALTAIPEVDVQVRYYSDPVAANERSSDGWQMEPLADYERYVHSPKSLYEVPGWFERVHIVGGMSHRFVRAIVRLLEKEAIEWCPWGERTGIRFARAVRFNSLMIHQLLPLLNRALRWKFAAQVNRSALGVFAIGLLAENDFVQWGINKDLIQHLYYSIDSGRDSGEFVCAQQEVPSRTLRIIYVGSLTYNKGIDVLIKALALVRSGDWALTLVGRVAKDDWFQGLAEDLGVASKIRWVGVVRSTRVSEFIASSDVLVLPSRFDGWGAVLNEAASAGKALISTTETGAAWHLIEPGRNGFRVWAGSVPELAAALDAYLRDPTIRTTHGVESRRLYVSEFTASRNAERLISSIVGWRRARQIGAARAFRDVKHEN